MPDAALWQRPVSYGTVGGTKAADLMSYPPPGYRPFQGRTRIGHGDARWEYAWTTLMTWGVQRNSGFIVDVTPSPPHVTEQTYVPVSFDGDGEPIVPSMMLDTDEQVFGPNGEAFIVPGDTAMLGISFGPFRVNAPARVVYVIDEPKRRGFAYGTMHGHPESGEEAFIVDQTDDGSVWLEIRAFSRPASRRWWLVYPALRLTQAYYTRRYFRALSAAID